jgi:hypothetical protein
LRGSFFALWESSSHRAKKRSARDAHLTAGKLVAAQHRSGAKESQATLYSL